MGVVRTLILSGGGGRGAFHAGVYQYLAQNAKPGLDTDHNGAWKPDIIVGTSIGAVNGAAIAQGKSAEEITSFWKSLREKDIEGLPPGMSWFARGLINLVMKNIIGVGLPVVRPADSTSPDYSKAFQPLPFLGKFGDWMLGRWSNLIDTGPLKKTMVERLGLDAAQIASSPQTLLINATEVATGRRMTFSNQPVFRIESGEARGDVSEGITINRILASCSIPLVYPWTFDQDTNRYYWDGALVNNTPIGVAMDAARAYHPDDVMEAVVVMMTPWKAEGLPNELPRNFADGITVLLDWILLASFRERLDLIQAYNRLARLGRQLGDPVFSKTREVRVTIVAPDDFMPAARILDYDARIDRLIEMGYQAAVKAFQTDYGTPANG